MRGVYPLVSQPWRHDNIFHLWTLHGVIVSTVHPLSDDGIHVHGQGRLVAFPHQDRWMVLPPCFDALVLASDGVEDLLALDTLLTKPAPVEYFGTSLKVGVG